MRNHAELNRAAGDIGSAERYLSESLTHFRSHFGADHPAQMPVIRLQADIYADSDRHHEAVAHYRKAIEIAEKSALSAHEIAALYDELAESLVETGDAGAAVDALKNAIEWLQQSDEAKELQSRGKQMDALVLRLLERLPGEERLTYGFQIAQLAHRTSVADSVAKMAARFSAGSDALGKRIRSLEQLKAELISRRELFTGNLSNPDFDSVTAVAGLNQLEEKIEVAQTYIAREFPGYNELVTPGVLPLEKVQRLLKPGEAVAKWLFGEESSYLWVIKHNGAHFYPLAGGRETVADYVKRLREHLDVSRIKTNAAKYPYPASLAFELYRLLLKPAEPVLNGIHTLVAVPDGAMRSLPMEVLITEYPVADSLSSDKDFQGAEWLINTYAVAYAPSVSALAQLRTHAAASSANRDFLGLGDPIVGEAAERRGYNQLADYPSLPESAQEVMQIAPCSMQTVI